MPVAGALPTLVSVKGRVGALGGAGTGRRALANCSVVMGVKARMAPAALSRRSTSCAIVSPAMLVMMCSVSPSAFAAVDDGTGIGLAVTVMVPVSPAMPAGCRVVLLVVIV